MVNKTLSFDIHHIPVSCTLKPLSLIRIANIFSHRWFPSTLKNLDKTPFIGHEALAALRKFWTNAFGVLVDVLQRHFLLICKARLQGWILGGNCPLILDTLSSCLYHLLVLPGRVDAVAHFLSCCPRLRPKGDAGAFRRGSLVSNSSLWFLAKDLKQWAHWVCATCRNCPPALIE